MHVASLSRATEILRSTALLLDEELCVNLRGRGLSCQACSDTCHVDALTLSPDGIDIDDEACTGCGACVPICPAGVMRLTGFVPERFLQALGGEQEVHLHCSNSQDGGGGVVIPCHRVLDTRLLAAALAEGTEIVYLHGLAACGDCPNGDAVEWVRQVEEELRRWFGEASPRLKTVRPSKNAAAGERKHEDQPHLSRRHFLRLAGAKAAGAVGWLLPVAEPQDIAEEIPFFQGDGDMKRPVVYQSLLAARVTRLPWADNLPLPWWTRTLSAECSACLVCGQRCPTGALDALEDDTSRAIRFEPALCTHCGLCQRLCPEKAVQPQAALTVNEVTAPRTPLIHRAMRRCGSCGNPFLPESSDADLCQTCLNEKQLDEEWLAMLEG